MIFLWVKILKLQLMLHILKSKEIVSSFKEENDYYRVYIKHRK